MVKALGMAKDELVSSFEISAVFYDLDIGGQKVLCRKHCAIKRKESKQNKKQAIVIMYNPGSCKPTGNYDGIKPVQAECDPTQVQLLRLMEYANLDWIEIENLSDICEGDSDIFKELLIETKDDMHSIFEPNRRRELSQDNDVIAILAWGKDGGKLKNLVSNVMETLASNNTFGYKKQRKRYYQRPLAIGMTKEDRDNWIIKVGDYIKVNL